MKSATISAAAALTRREMISRQMKAAHEFGRPSARPIVGAEKNTKEEYCTRAVDRLQEGFTDTSAIIGTGDAFTDTTFPTSDVNYEENMIWWEDYNDYWDKETDYGYWFAADCLSDEEVDGYTDGTCYYARWSDVWPSINLFDADGTVDWTDITQGNTNTCYMVAALSSIAPFSDVAYSLFPDTARNEEGIYNVRLFIRGKPWIVTVDDIMLFQEGDSYFLEMSTTEPTLVLGQQAEDNNAVWGAVVEKAWSKVKGNLENSQFGTPSNALRALTGVPVYDYWTMDDCEDWEPCYTAEQIWQYIYDANAGGYPIMTSTEDGDDRNVNEYNIGVGHSYSVMDAFTMTDAAGTAHKMVLIRNPWGSNGYDWTWSPDDPNWTADLIAQIPNGFDPTAQSQDDTGIFVVPMEAFGPDDTLGAPCFSDITIAHTRESEGYTTKWYDCIDCGSEEFEYSYTATTNSLPIYFTLETYYPSIVPYECHNLDDGPSGLLDVFYGDENPYGWFYWGAEGAIKIDTYDAGQVFTLLAEFYWDGNPRQDFTVGVYSVDASNIYDTDGNTNMMHCDGQSPSEFEYYATINPNMPSTWQTDPETTTVTSIFDIMAKADTFSHFLAYINNNKWVLFDPFGVIF